MMHKQSFRPVLVALGVILVGLFMLCAHQQTIETPGEDLTREDEAFREELLEMLDLADQGSEGLQMVEIEPASPDDATITADTAGEAEEDMEESEAELLALIAAMEEEVEDGENVESFQPQSDTDTLPVLNASAVPQKKTSQAYTTLADEVRRLEYILDQQSEQVDSLRRIIDNRNARIMELQTQVAAAAPAAAPPLQEPAPQQSVPNYYAAATESPVNYQPVSQLSGPIVQKYNKGRQAFESYNYRECIQIMQDLLQEGSESSLADNAQYWIGESFYGLKEYQKAIMEFQKVFAYQAADKYDDAQLMIGLCYVRMDQPELARSTFGDFLDNYRSSEYSGIARRYYENI